jgi:peptide/nickel transport system substrate-binding protein
VRDEGGLILPMFNDWIDAHTEKLQGYVKDGSGEQSNGYVMRRAWLA